MISENLTHAINWFTKKNIANFYGCNSSTLSKQFFPILV